MKSVIQSAKGMAISLGYPDLADDFAQDAAIRLLEGRKATLRQLFIDFLRTECGRADGAQARGAERRAWREIVPSDLVETGEAEDGTSWSFLLALADKEMRSILVLHFEWGLELKEIGHCLGVSEGRVCQLLKEALKKMRKRVNNEARDPLPVS